MGALPGSMSPPEMQEPELTADAREKSDLAMIVGYAGERNYAPVDESSCTNLNEGSPLAYMNGWDAESGHPTEEYEVEFHSLCPAVKDQPRSALVRVKRIKRTETGREVGEELEASRLNLYHDLLASR